MPLHAGDYLDGQPVDVRQLLMELHIWLTSIASYLGQADRVDETRLPGKVFFDYVRYYDK